MVDAFLLALFISCLFRPCLALFHCSMAEQKKIFAFIFRASTDDEEVRKVEKEECFDSV